MKRFFASLIALALAILPAQSDMLLTGVGSGNGSAPPAAVSSFGAYLATCPSNSTTCTTSAMAIGAADPARFVVVYTAWSRASAISSMTIGGIAATQLASVDDGANLRTYYFGATVPTGTTAVVVMNHTGTGNALGIVFATWSLYNLLSTTPLDTKADTTRPGNITLTTQAGGIALCIAYTVASPATIAFSTLTQDFNATYLTSAILNAGASGPTSGTTLSQTATYTGTSSGSNFVGISFR